MSADLQSAQISGGCLIPGLSDDLALLCLSRIPFVLRMPLRAVCPLWRKALASEDFSFTCRWLQTSREHLCLQLQETDNNSFTSRKLSFIVWDSLLVRGVAIPPISCAQLCEGLDTGGMKDAPSGITDYQVVSVGPCVVVLGGTFIWRDENYKIDSNLVWMFDAEKYVWSRLPNMLCPRKRFAAVALTDKKILVTGGFYDVRVEIFSLTTGRWKAVAKMPTRSFYPPTALVNNAVVFVIPQTPSIGGAREALLYSVKQNKWRIIPKFWPAEGSLNTCHAMAAIGNDLYGICATREGSSAVKAAVFIRNMATKEWEPFSPLLAAGEVNVADSGSHFMVALRGKIHVVENSETGVVMSERSSSCYVQVLNDTYDDTSSGVQFSSKGTIAPMNIQKWRVANKAVCGVTVLKV